MQVLPDLQHGFLDLGSHSRIQWSLILFSLLPLLDPAVEIVFSPVPCCTRKRRERLYQPLQHDIQKKYHTTRQKLGGSQK
jgi:hypothetical protein